MARGDKLAASIGGDSGGATQVTLPRPSSSKKGAKIVSRHSKVFAVLWPSAVGIQFFFQGGKPNKKQAQANANAEKMARAATSLMDALDETTQVQVRIARKNSAHHAHRDANNFKAWGCINSVSIHREEFVGVATCVVLRGICGASLTPYQLSI